MPNLNYGKIAPEQQLHFLKKLLQKIKKETQLSTEDEVYLSQIKTKLDEYNFEASGQLELENTIKKIKTIIETIETNNKNADLLQAFKNFGLYRILYHNPLVQGIDDKGDLSSLLKTGFAGVGISAVALLLFTAAALLGAPLWVSVIANALFASSATYLAALIYGVVNDLFATKSNLAYFLLGHQPQQTSLLRTNDPVAQGIAWGVAATFGPALIASIAFGIGVAITASFVPVASFVFPAMFVAMPLIAWGADKYAKKKAKEYEQFGHDYYGNLEHADLGSNSYQYQGLKIMSASKADKAAWLANSDRNVFGFTKVPLIGLGALATIITLSATHSYLPAFLFSTLFATAVPAAFVFAAVSFLTGAGIYTYVNRNKQIDNRSKLAFEPNANLKHELYLDEDLDLVEELSQDYNPKSNVIDMPQKPGHYPSPLQSSAQSIKNEEALEKQPHSLSLAKV